MNTQKLSKTERVVFSEEIVRVHPQEYGAYKGHTFVVDRVCAGEHYQLKCEDDPRLEIKGAVHGGDLVRLDPPKIDSNPPKSYEDAFNFLSEALKARAEQAALSVATAYNLITQVEKDDMSGVEYAWKVVLSEKDESDFKPISVSFTLADPEERGEDKDAGVYAVVVDVTGEGGVYLGSTETDYTDDFEVLKQQLQEISDRSIVAALLDAPRKENLRKPKHRAAKV